MNIKNRETLIVAFYVKKIFGLNVSLYVSPLAQKGEFIQINPPYARLASLDLKKGANSRTLVG